MAVRAAAGLVGMVVAVTSSSGCAESGAAADDKPAGEHLATVRQAVDHLVRAGTSRTRTSLSTTSGGTRVTITGSGRFDYAGRRGTLTVTPPDADHGGTAAGGEAITELFTPGALHMKNRGAGVPDDKWVRVDTTRLADGNLLTNGATDPLRAAALLRGALAVSYEGQERFSGTVVRHYSGTGALDAAARAAAEADASAEQLSAAAEGFEEDSFTFDAWFDGQGRLRKVRHHFASVSVTSTTTMFDFGVPVSLRMPDPADIYTGRIAAAG